MVRTHPQKYFYQNKYIKSKPIYFNNHQILFQKDSSSLINQSHVHYIPDKAGLPGAGRSERSGPNT